MQALWLVGVLAGSLAIAGCPKRPEVIQAAPAPVGPPAATVTAPPPAPTPPPPPPAPAPAPAPAAAVPAPPPLKDIFFNFDKAVIRDDQKAALNDNVSWLKANPQARILIEGHCDERGTAEYNLALGERRARAAKDYLVGAGIAADRVSTISYGKERPFVLGNDESAWKWNRRAHFVLQGR